MTTRLRASIAPHLLCLFIALPSAPALAESKFDREIGLLDALLVLGPGSVVAAQNLR